jgi:hypothetical protein
MISYRKFVVFGLLLLLLTADCKKRNKDFQSQANNPEFLHAGIRRITDIIRHDIFAPPVSARIYAYAAVAGYEALVPGFPEYQSLAGQIKGLEPCPQPDPGKEYCFPLASVNAMLTVGKQLIFSEGDIQDLKEEIFVKFQKMDIPSDVYDRSMIYGDLVARHILAWSKTDNYAQTRSAPKYAIDTKIPYKWRPTPPMYGDALEPHWREIRTWVIDSAKQFQPPPHVIFSTDERSGFFRQANEVRLIGKSLTPMQSETAWYWDDNPFALEVEGHLMFSKKKISPGGHWMNIAAHACRKANADMMKTAETYVRVSCALADAFISCWDAKYSFNLIRPESYINQYIDQDWHPLIQTPPFPEYTPGHSTISSSAASALTVLYGDHFSFTDSTETEFGIPPRTFASFMDASREAGMSRIYGGIHYRQSNDAGIAAGTEIGRYVAMKLVTKKTSR